MKKFLTDKDLKNIIKIWVERELAINNLKDYISCIICSSKNEDQFYKLNPTSTIGFSKTLIFNCNMDEDHRFEVKFDNITAKFEMHIYLENICDNGSSICRETYSISNFGGNKCSINYSKIPNFAISKSISHSINQISPDWIPEFKNKDDLIESIKGILTLC